ncbi:unnamed protein product [Bursaphelenchus xylophilus]|uniref:(pine wood nematode) hypothetical protein n=1 Tax=Bursaphelenchus xylophilus TaxID=6326 RepID=A0A1I7RJ35_BURXY|nr:unnamed protein product [Bursaphelenchus xylophilus]CAG9119313.1 unnamed protein product [Bursaphelenchus xylophilus]
MTSDEIAQLRAEIADLTQKLEEADDAKTKAGLFGLQLVQEKEFLEQQKQELSRDKETLQQELESCKEALNKYRDEHRNAAISELHHEASLYEDKEKLEEEFKESVKQYEERIKVLTQELERNKVEIERLQTSEQEQARRLEEVEEQRKQFKDELKDLKDREQKLVNENNDLEEENVNLQKQVSNLKSGQIEYENLKVDFTRVLEENEHLRNQDDENRRFQEMYEKQIEESLEQAKHERELRHSVQKELEHMKNQEQMSNLNSLYMSFSAAKADNDEERVNELERSMIADAPLDSIKLEKGTDLFSELHGSEIAKLQEENDNLNKQLEDFKENVGRALSPLLQKLQLAGLTDSSDIVKLKDIIHDAVAKLDDKFKSGTPDKATERKVEQLKSDLRSVILALGTKHAQLAAAQDRFLHLGEHVAQLYGEIAANGGEDEERQRKVTAIQQTIRNLAKKNAEVDENEDSGVETPESERDTKSPKTLPSVNVSRTLISQKLAQEVSSKLQSGVTLNELLNEADRREKLAEEQEDLVQSFDAFQEVMKVLRQATENVVQSKMAMEDKDKAELCQQISKLKSLLNVKREQVSSLRTVLRSNKSVNENALQSLKSKFDTEKKIKDETIAQLRKELKQFKEDAATFASNRAMHTARNEELQAQNEQLRKKLDHVEEEKKTLNQLLRMSIQQKLSATQRLEELEIDRERSTFKRPIRQPQGPPQPQREVRAVRYPAGGQANNNQTSPRGSK